MSTTLAVDRSDLSRCISARLGGDEGLLDEMESAQASFIERRARLAEAREEGDRESLRAEAERLRALRARLSVPVIWEQGDAALMVYPLDVDVQLTSGWLVVAVDVECEETGRVTMKLVFFLGAEARGDGLGAAFSFDPGCHPGLVAGWGGALRAAVWDGVLDVLESAVGQAGELCGTELSLLGFSAGEQEVRVEVGA